ncbi:class I SAM-dependent methyltransferase [Paenibacillus sp. GCM10023252]|uniref:class I SAM-dependent methyltransferase n=1 Tax=Paenibacillus sp. GCM10023252 TaxID=3252649 RepID=UPI0036210241
MNSKERFTNRVDSYAKYRPSYPADMIQYLYRTVGLCAASLIADIGAGTGIFTKLLLTEGSQVIAIEPNEAMREASMQELVEFDGYQSMAGSAENTNLPDQSVDFIVCAQAFHWFDRPAAKVEFARVLKPEGKAALIWNSRRTSGTPFLEEYDQLLRTYGTDYAKVNHQNISANSLALFFKEGSMRVAEFHNEQKFDYDGLLGRMLSSSYVPLPGHPSYEPMTEAAMELFVRCQQNGQVTIEYLTEVYWGEV